MKFEWNGQKYEIVFNDIKQSIEIKGSPHDDLYIFIFGREYTSFIVVQKDGTIRKSINAIIEGNGETVYIKQGIKEDKR